MEIDAEDGEFDYTLASDLLEHLSPQGLETAVKEICRVTAKKVVIHFFSMQDIPQHKINPIRNYHWNWLSRDQTCRLFEKYCKPIEIVWVREYLNKKYDYHDYYNKNSHTFFMEKKGGI